MVFATPDGEVHASVVHSMSVRLSWKITQMIIGDYGRIADITGEALVADLGRGNVLFALMPSAFLSEEAGFVHYRRGMGRRLADRDPIVLTKNMSSFGDIRPTFVRFRDLADPNTLKVVDPDDLEARFGAGYAVKSMTLSLVDAPRTEGRVKMVLPWLEDLGRRQFYILEHPEGLGTPLPRKYTISPTAFDAELLK